MTRWFFLFFLAITIVVSYRILTFSPAPIDTSICDDSSIESKLSGIWDLNRIDNFSGFRSYLKIKNLENYSLIINSLFPSLISSSQILIIDICGDKMSLSYNYFRNWQQFIISLINEKEIKSNLNIISSSRFYNSDSLNLKIKLKDIDFEQEIYLDGGELIREIEFLNSSTGKVKFIYRKNE
tara:strand:- start:488 stop:1033 length:546 start_codon:yes stop_codon:yes gene_type:complete